MPRHADDHSPDLSPEPPTDPGLPIQPDATRQEPHKPRHGDDARPGPAHAAPEAPDGLIPHQAGEASFATADNWAADGWTADGRAADHWAADHLTSGEATADGAHDSTASDWAEWDSSAPDWAATKAATQDATRDGAPDEDGHDGGKRSVTARIVSPRTVRVLAYVVGLALLVGGIAAVKMGHTTSPTDSTAASRDDQRASRDMVRETASPLTSATPTATAAVSVGSSPTPTAVPTTAPPVATKAPAPAPTKAAPKATVAAPPARAAGCSAYSGNRLIACNLLPSFGFSTSEMAALDPMWNNESGWNASAENPGSGAYGIPQALPGSKMATAGSDWATNPATQIKWGLDYIKQRYGSPSAAWSFWQANGWY